LDKKEELIRIAQENQSKHAKGAPILSQTEAEQQLTQAKTEIDKVTSDSPTKGSFGDVSSFAERAKPYVEKIIKGAKIALTILGMFI
jgi:hypothetical protein